MNNYLAIATTDLFLIYDTKNFKKIHNLCKNNFHNNVEFCPDGKYLIGTS